MHIVARAYKHVLPPWWFASRALATWHGTGDLITTAALLFTAFVTPVEVAFMQPPPPSMRWVDPLFLLNRVVDLM